MMAVMRADELMRSIDRLSYGERVRLLATEARRLRGSAELDGLLDELGGGDPFERSLGISVAQVAGHAGYVTRMLTDPVPAVQAHALGAAASGVPVADEVLVRLYDDASAELRRQLLRAVRAGRRSRLASRLIDRHREWWGDRAGASLLSSCDPDSVRRLLPELGYCLSPGQWKRLGARHPDVVLGYADQSLASVPDAAGREQWWTTVGWGVVGTIEADPRAVVRVVERALPPVSLPQPVVDVLGRLTDIAPDVVLRMLTRPERSEAVRRSAFTPAFRRRLPRFDDEDLAALGRITWPVEQTFAGLLDALPPTRRTKVFEAVTAALDLSQVVFGNDLLDVLPHTERHRQARRLLGLAAVRDLTQLTWQVTARLPYDEAFAQLSTEVRRPDATDRAAVYRAVLESAGLARDPDAVRRALEWSRQVRNDQDPVRGAVLSAAAAVPASLLTDDQVPALDVLLTDALEARDASWGSTAALTRLAETAVRQGVLRDRPALLDWGLRAHERLAGRSGSVQLYGITNGLPRGRETAVYDALRPRIEAAAARDEFGLAFALARALVRRGRDLAPLHDVLGRATRSEDDSTAGTAVGLWLEPPATRGERTAVLLDADVAMARWDSVWSAVTDQRTDLLDRVLADPGRSRRFDRDLPRWQVPQRSVRRWLPRQRARFAELLAAAAADPQLPDWARSSAVSTLGSIPGAGRPALDAFLGHRDVLLAEAALGALAWTDRPDQELPVLLAHAGDDRARVAVYAATRAARFVRPAALAEVLRPMLVGEGMKVTSRKEAARLLGQLRAPGAAAILAAAWPDAHRDVRAAITSAAAQHLLYDPESWPLLETAATGPAATARVVAVRPPFDLAMRHRAPYGRLVLRTCGHADRDVATSGLASLRNWGRWVPEAAATCAAVVTDLDSGRSPCTAAIASLVALVPVSGERDLVRAVRRLAELDGDPRTARDAGAEQDRPARRRLESLVSSLRPTVTREDLARRGALRAVADELAERPDLLPLRVDLLVTGLPWADLGAGLDELAGLVADRPVLAAELARQVDSRLRGQQAHWQPADLDPLSRRYGDRGDLAGGLLAVVLTGRAGDRAEWPAARRERLAVLRRHPDADVRSAALAVVTAGD